MQALTANELLILKDKFQAGSQGHRQKVLLTAYTPTASDRHAPAYPSGDVMPNGQIGIIYRANESPYGIGDTHTTFQAYKNEGALLPPMTIFPYNTCVLGLATWKGLVLAIAWDSVSLKVRSRVSSDSAATWDAEADLIPGAVTIPALATTWNNNGKYPSLQLVANRAGTSLYLFYMRNVDRHIVYRVTTNADPRQGWGAETDTNFVVPSTGRNYGGTTGNNQETIRAFVMCESKTAGTWVVICESDDGDWHANHMMVQGSLGGVWTKKLNIGFGGALSGNQGATGGLFRDRNGDLLAYFMESDGIGQGFYRSLDSGSTWTLLWYGAMAFPDPSGGGLGCGFGRYDEFYTQREYVWGMGSVNLVIGVEGSGMPSYSTFTYPKWVPIIGNGTGVVGQTLVPTTVDVSNRVISIALDKAAGLDCDTFNLELANEDGLLNINTDGGVPALNAYAQPNVEVDIYQWHGVVANSVQTFHGITDSVRQHDSPRTSVHVGRDGNKKLLVQEIRLIAPQDLKSVDVNGVANYVRDMGNFVFLNKTLNEVLSFVLDYGSIPRPKVALAPSTFVFKELRGADGQTLLDFIKRACDLAGMDFWCDELGVYRTKPIAAIATSSYTFRSKEDITVLDPEVNDDSLKTRVRILGKANVGARYLSEQFKFPGLGAPAGLAYDKTTKSLWYLDQNSNLYRLNPQTNPMTVLAGPFALGLGYPDGLSVDPLDNHLWVSDGFDASVGNSVNRKYKKIDRNTQLVLLGPFTNPDGDHCDLYAWDSSGTGAGPVQIKMTTFTSGQIVTMSTAGAEVGRVASPATSPTALDADTGGGLFLVAWDAVDFYQVSFAGAIINTIKEDSKNSNAVATVTDSTVYDFGDVYLAWKNQNLIVKFALINPSGIDTATYAEAVDTLLESSLGGEVRLARIVDLAVTDKAMAQRVANRQLDRLHLNARPLTFGAIGNPGIQKFDRITLSVPGANVASDWRVLNLRSDQLGRDGTYLMVVTCVPYRGLL